MKSRNWQGMFDSFLVVLTVFIAVYLISGACNRAEAASCPNLKAKIIRVVDGDTVEIKLSVRVADIDAPEMNTREGKNAKRYLQDRLELYSVPTLGGLFKSVPTTISVRNIDRYGRLVGRVLTDELGDISPMMVEAGHAKDYVWRGRQWFKCDEVTNG